MAGVCCQKVSFQFTHKGVRSRQDVTGAAMHSATVREKCIRSCEYIARGFFYGPLSFPAMKLSTTCWRAQCVYSSRVSLFSFQSCVKFPSLLFFSAHGTHKPGYFSTHIPEALPLHAHPCFGVATRRQGQSLSVVLRKRGTLNGKARGRGPARARGRARARGMARASSEFAHTTLLQLSR